MSKHGFDLSGQRIDFAQAVYFIIEKLNPYSGFVGVCGKYLNHVSSYTKLVSGKVDIVALILKLNQLVYQLVSFLFHTGTQ